MTSVKSFRIDDILVGTQSKKRKSEVDTDTVTITTVRATEEKEIVKVEEDDEPTPSISPVLRNKLAAEKRKEKKFGKRGGKIEEANTSTTSDDSGNSSRSSTPTDLSITSTVIIKAKASEGPKSPIPSTSTSSPSSDEGNNSNHSKDGDEKSSEGESETKSEQIDKSHGTRNAAGIGSTSIANGLSMLGGSGFYPYANHPHFPIMFPMTSSSSSGGVSVSQEGKGYLSTPSFHFSAAASATAAGSLLADPFLSKGRPFFGGARHPSSALLALGGGLDFSMYSQHHPGFPGGFYGLPSMHDAVATQQKAHHQQLMNDRLNYPASMFQMNRPMFGSSAAAVSSACKRKGGQIRFTNSQTAQLEKSFVQQKYLNATDRKKLANSLGLSDRQVKTWFQNRRAKLRKCKGGICVESDVYTQSMKGSP